jgi:carbohydrate-selective porin OprB
MCSILFASRDSRGIGVFGRFGASDGDPNFMHYFYSLGIGGKGVIPSRVSDQCGFGYWHRHAKGFSTCTPVLLKSRVFRVATVKPC